MKKLFIALIGMTIAMPSAFAATWHVSPDGTDTNSGATWTLAKKTIQAGVDVAGSGDTVLVTNGTYLLTNSVYISSGGWNAGRGIIVKSVNGASVTIVNGNYPAAISSGVNLNDGNDILDGFTITNCSGGVGNCGTVQNCVISGNNCGNGDFGTVNNSGTILNCVISGNRSGFGGGVYNNYGHTVQNCVISGNTAANNGGGLFNEGTVQNCTISGNTAANTGGGLYNMEAAVANCIVYYNENGDFYGNAPYYSCAPGLSGNGNITNEPCFYDPGTGFGNNHIGGDFRLQSNSRCINAGYNMDWMATATDIEGNPRIIYKRVDMGAYESPYESAYAIEPTIKANGATGTVIVNYSEIVSVTVKMNAGSYAGINKDWWIVALAGSSWYYLNSAIQWTEFDGNLSNCHPVYRGGLFNLPATEVLNISGLPKGSYTFWFAVDQMDGNLNVDGPVLVDSVNVAVQ